MKKANFLLLTVLFLISTAFVAPQKENVHKFNVKDITGKDVALSKYKGKTLLIVNVASKCGLTPQYEDLQGLYEAYQDHGLIVMGFPANNFMSQEPGSNDQISSFCTQKYGVTFPMFSKVSVKGKDIHPLYQYLTDKKKNKAVDAPVKWNFQKFLVNTEGDVVKSFAPGDRVNDLKILKAIQSELTKSNKSEALKNLIKEDNAKKAAEVKKKR